MPGTSEEQKGAGVAGLKEEEKKSQRKRGQVSQGHDHHCIGYGLLPNKRWVHLSESVRADPPSGLKDHADMAEGRLQRSRSRS